MMNAEQQAIDFLSSLAIDKLRNMNMFAIHELTGHELVYLAQYSEYYTIEGDTVMGYPKLHFIDPVILAKVFKIVQDWASVKGWQACVTADEDNNIYGFSVYWQTAYC